MCVCVSAEEAGDNEDEFIEVVEAHPVAPAAASTRPIVANVYATTAPTLDSSRSGRGMVDLSAPKSTRRVFAGVSSRPAVVTPSQAVGEEKADAGENPQPNAGTTE